MSENISEHARWYALTVRYQHERQTERTLQFKGFETLVPWYRSRRLWSDRIRDVDMPLFAGYVLCHFALTQRAQVLDTPGVASVVGFGGHAVALENSEIVGIQRVLASKLPLAPWPYLKAGDRVRVEHGAMRGLEGTLLRTKGALRLVIGVDLLQRAVAVELDRDEIVPESKRVV
jgi:transcription antitermination factor NusG